jgi:hypothetical protein
MKTSLKSNPPFKSLYFLGILFLGITTQAFEYRLGASFGFGGTGIKSVAQINGVDVDVNRSDGPGVISLSVETPYDNTSTFALDHTRGFTLAPFSNGVDFNGFTWRYYYPNFVPTMVKSKSEQSTLLIKELCPYVGPTVGIARGLINRQNDLVEEVSATGVFFGLHTGVDYQIFPNLVARGDLAFATTLGSSGFVKSSLSEFAMTAGFYYILD